MRLLRRRGWWRGQGQDCGLIAIFSSHSRFLIKACVCCRVGHGGGDRIKVLIHWNIQFTVMDFLRQIYLKHISHAVSTFSQEGKGLARVRLVISVCSVNSMSNTHTHTHTHTHPHTTPRYRGPPPVTHHPLSRTTHSLAIPRICHTPAPDRCLSGVG